MPLIGLAVVLIVGLLSAQILVLLPLELVSGLKVPVWLIGLGALIGFAWCLGE